MARTEPEVYYTVRRPVSLPAVAKATNTTPAVIANYLKGARLRAGMRIRKPVGGVQPQAATPPYALSQPSLPAPGAPAAYTPAARVAGEYGLQPSGVPVPPPPPPRPRVSEMARGQKPYRAPPPPWVQPPSPAQRVGQEYGLNVTPPWGYPITSDTFLQAFTGRTGARSYYENMMNIARPRVIYGSAGGLPTAGLPAQFYNQFMQAMGYTQVQPGIWLRNPGVPNRIWQTKNWQEVYGYGAGGIREPTPLSVYIKMFQASGGGQMPSRMYATPQMMAQEGYNPAEFMWMLENSGYRMVAPGMWELGGAGNRAIVGAGFPALGAGGGGGGGGGGRGQRRGGGAGWGGGGGGGLRRVTPETGPLDTRMAQREAGFMPTFFGGQEAYGGGGQTVATRPLAPSAIGLVNWRI